MSFLISSQSSAFASLTTYLGPHALHQPGSWGEPSLVEIGRDIFLPLPIAEMASIYSPLPIGERARERVDPISANLTFWAGPKRPSHKGPASSTPPPPVGPESLDIANEIFADLERRLPLANTFEKRHKLWAEFRDVMAFLPDTDLADAKKRITDFVTELAYGFYKEGIETGTLWTAAGFYQKMKEYQGERRSLGGLATRAIRDFANNVRLKKIDAAQQDILNWLQKEGENWGERDFEFLLLLWNEPVQAPFDEKLFTRIEDRAALSVLQTDLGDLQVAGYVLKVATLFAEAPVKAQTVGEFIQSDINQDLFQERKKLVELRLKRGADGWDSTWNGSLAALPPTESGFIRLELLGEELTVYLGNGEEIGFGVTAPVAYFPMYGAFLATDERVDPEIRSRISKRIMDVRINKANMDAFFWTVFQEMAHGEEPLQRKLLEALPLFQNFTLEKMRGPSFDPIWFTGFTMITQQPPFSLTQLMQGFEEILEEGGYFRARVGNSYTGISRKGREKLVGDDLFCNMVTSTGFRTFSDKEVAAFEWFALSEAEKKHLQGIRAMYVLGLKMIAVINHLEEIRLSVESAEREGLREYEAIVRQVADKEISPSEGGSRVLKIVLRDFPQILGEQRVSYIFREAVEPEEDKRLSAQFLAEGLECVCEFLNAEGWLEPLTAIGIRRILEASLLIMKAKTDSIEELGELLDTGRRVSPHDDGYTLEEFQHLAIFQRELVTVLLREGHPVNAFKKSVAQGIKPFSEKAPFASSILLLDRRMKTQIPFRRFIDGYLKKPATIEMIVNGAKIRELLRSLCWLEVIINAMENYLKFTRGEAYDEELMKALVAVYLPDVGVDRQHETVSKYFSEEYAQMVKQIRDAQALKASKWGLSAFYPITSIDPIMRPFFAEFHKRFHRQDFLIPKDTLWAPKNADEKKQAIYFGALNTLIQEFNDGNGNPALNGRLNTAPRLTDPPEENE